MFDLIAYIIHCALYLLGEVAKIWVPLSPKEL